MDYDLPRCSIMIATLRLTEESVFLCQSVGGVAQSLRSRRRFAEQAYLTKKLADLRMVPRSGRRHRRTGTAQHQRHQQGLHRCEVVSAASEVNLLNQAGYFCDVSRALLEVPNIVDLTDFDESVLRRICTRPGIVIANHGQGACGRHLCVEFHELGNGRLATPRPQR